MAHTESFLSELYQREYNMLFRIAFRLTGSREDAQDFIQKTFLLAVSQQDELKVHPNPEGWLVVTLNNLIKNDRRRLEKRMEIPMDSIPYMPAKKDELPLNSVLPIGLAKEDRRLLILKFEHQLDYREISKQLGMSPGACRVRIYRLLKKCHALMQELNSQN